MNTENRIILEITPQTGLKLAPGIAMLMYVPEECPVSCGLPRRSLKQPVVTVKTMKKDFPDLYEVLGGENYRPRKRRKEIRYGCPHCLSHDGLRLKRRVERRDKYKKDLFQLCKEAGFTMPSYGWSIYFYFALPKEWSKKKRRMFHGQPHQAKPDADNIYKLFADSLLKEDETIAQLSGLGKFWVDKVHIDENGDKKRGEGFIEILLNQPIYNPMNVQFINQKEAQKEPKRAYKKGNKRPPPKRKYRVKPKPLKLDKRFKKDNLR